MKYVKNKEFKDSGEDKPERRRLETKEVDPEEPDVRYFYD
jgi:hypothetical protein